MNYPKPENIFVYIAFVAVIVLIVLTSTHQGQSSATLEAAKRIERMEGRQLDIMEEMGQNKKAILANQEIILENQQLQSNILKRLEEIIDLHKESMGQNP